MIKSEYSPPPKKSIEFFEGAYWHTYLLPNNCDIQMEIKKLIKQQFNFSVSKFIESSFSMVGAADKPRPHTDEAKGATY